MADEVVRCAGRSGARWRTAVAQLKRESSPVCWICGADIDMTLDYRDRMSWTADHVTPLSLGGDPYDPANLRPAHRRCNSIKGAGRAPVPLVASRRW
ncbi:HNH endonuclease signature motif containing protein [Streptomyces sp. NPDC018019]|uniref:HNH endonuclease signature motif containing protein n=1 Tax=Streptomyces sp. NPDC018019 TaxID=3365030 RepID=UPI0037B100B6